MELTRLVVIYLHLIACCVAIGLVFTSDFAMLRKLLIEDPRKRDNIKHLKFLKAAVSWSLVALWLTGIGVVGLDYLSKGAGYFGNPKLQAKIAVVLILTFNGFLLHESVLPAIRKFGSLLRMPLNIRVMAMAVGAVSGVSWLYAAMLGVGRPLAWKYSLFELLVAYPFLVAVAFVTVLAVASWARLRPRTGPFHSTFLFPQSDLAR